MSAEASAIDTGPLVVCVVGHGTIGALHVDIAAAMGAGVEVVEPAAARAPVALPRWRAIEELPAGHAVDIWIVCTPTRTHLASLSAILRRDPAACVLLEKPACRASEVDHLTTLLRAHPRARVVVMDQYRHATALSTMADMLGRRAPGAPVHTVRVAFSKDRRADIAAGRFVDRDHGVFGYEWLHMLAVLRYFLPPRAFVDYLTGPLAPDSLRVAHDPDLFVSAAIERTTIGRTGTELFSTVVGEAAEGHVPRPAWTRQFPSVLDERQRLVRVETDRAVCTAELEPIAPTGGGPITRNLHRITLETANGTWQRTVFDSPLHNAALRLVTELRAEAQPRLDLLPLRRIATLTREAHGVRAVPTRPGRPTRNAAGGTAVAAARQ